MKLSHAVSDKVWLSLVSPIFTSKFDLMQDASRLWSSQTHSCGQNAQESWNKLTENQSSNIVRSMAVFITKLVTLINLFC